MCFSNKWLQRTTVLYLILAQEKKKREKKSTIHAPEGDERQRSVVTQSWLRWHTSPDNARRTDKPTGQERHSRATPSATWMSCFLSVSLQEKLRGSLWRSEAWPQNYSLSCWCHIAAPPPLPHFILTIQFFSMEFIPSLLTTYLDESISWCL